MRKWCRIYAYFYRLFQVIYPAYHSQYDTFDYVADHVDPGFVYHGIMAELYTTILYKLGDSFILPLDVRNYGKSIHDSFKDYQSRDFRRVTQIEDVHWFMSKQTVIGI